MTKPSATADRRSDRHRDTRRQILDAAWALSREHGLQGWTLKDLAAEVEMRAPSLYVYFDGKDAIYDAMFADGNRALLELIGAADRDADPDTLIRDAARLFLDFCVQDPVRHQLLFLRPIPGFAPSPESYALAGEVLDETAALLIAAGHDDPEDLDLWTALVTGIATQQVSNDPGGDRWVRLLDRAVDGYLASR